MVIITDKNVKSFGIIIYKILIKNEIRFCGYRMCCYFIRILQFVRLFFFSLKEITRKIVFYLFIRVK